LESRPRVSPWAIIFVAFSDIRIPDGTNNIPHGISNIPDGITNIPGGITNIPGGINRISYEICLKPREIRCIISGISVNRFM
jgi:hypothetical protein